MLSLKMKRWEKQYFPNMKLDLQEEEGIAMNERSVEARIGVVSGFSNISPNSCSFRFASSGG